MGLKYMPSANSSVGRPRYLRYMLIAESLFVGNSGPGFARTPLLTLSLLTRYKAESNTKCQSTVILCARTDPEAVR